MEAVKQFGRRFLAQITRNGFFRALLRGFSSRGLLPSSVWRRLPVSGEFKVQASGLSFRYVTFPNDVIGRALYWRGLDSWETETISSFIDLVRKANVFIDVGANTGIYTLIGLAVNPSLKVIAFEPVPRIRQRLADNVRVNGWTERCAIRSEAVSDIAGTAEFHVPFSDCPTSASLNLTGFRGFEGELIQVPVITLDSACADLSNVDLVKIDVEGFEDRALAGMQAVLEQHAPDLLLECNPDGPLAGIERALAPWGYQYYHLTDAGPVPRPAFIPDLSEQFRNYLCSKRAGLPAPRA